MAQRKKEKQIWSNKRQGRPSAFSSAAELEMAACEYFKWCDENPMYKEEWQGGRRVQTAIRRPYTLEALCIYCDVGMAYFRQFLVQKEMPEGFSTVIEKIRQTVYNQKFEGAATGFFNASIISRDLGLVDKKAVDGNIHLSDDPIIFE